jgi:hypothetical protein
VQQIGRLHYIGNSWRCSFETVSAISDKRFNYVFRFLYYFYRIKEIARNLYLLTPVVVTPKFGLIRHTALLLSGGINVPDNEQSLHNVPTSVRQLSLKRLLKPVYH